MPVNELFSKRQKREGADEPEVYKYNDIPRPLRVQALEARGKFE
jgi:hypothetical protein